MTDKITPADAIPAMIEAFAGMSAVFATVIEFAAGHRAQALDAGFSETAAEQMAMAAHGVALGLLLSGQKR